eukprot:gnl/TRDRNA2_/TRDRNA2_84552_c0_seq2.p1 gnl/TRDRNA2_/TRDRNA2_84552_c0~~gnl/TRDRNA2_/TRDRNA2_84552_c0_seq2.p1  ORF type:complete len:182 (+),score=37.53 gnl/TRDRNA2_/TRDRNA2_84552_c0_seq2:58-603(+)
MAMAVADSRAKASKMVYCPDLLDGRCARGATCPYGHSLRELLQNSLKSATPASKQAEPPRDATIAAPVAAEPLREFATPRCGSRADPVADAIAMPPPPLLPTKSPKLRPAPEPEPGLTPVKRARVCIASPLGINPKEEKIIAGYDPTTGSLKENVCTNTPPRKRRLNILARHNSLSEVGGA